jgi:peptidoglycan-associated lipoprotein
MTLIAACSTPQPPSPGSPAASPTAAPQPATPASPAAPGAAASRGATASTLAPHLDPKHPIATERSLYFDYDEFTIRRDDVALVERHGRYLAANPTLTVRIEGNADERGSSEYNLALGQKRAQAVATALRVFGVRDAQMEAVSWGEEKPRRAEHDEAAWAENRRADIVYTRR